MDDELLYPHIMRAVYAAPWAILPETMAVIDDLLSLRISGGRLTDDEIEARLAVAAERQGPRNGPRKGLVAVVPVYGTIMPRGGMMTRMSGGTSVQEIKAMFDESMGNPDVSSVLLDIDSPGGQVDGVFELANHIRASRQSNGGEKPVVAIANTLMASAAYLIGSAADEIVAMPSSQVGSIGVLMPHMDKTGADEQAGVKTTLVTAGKYKAEGFGPLTDEARAAIQSRVDGYYDMLVTDVAKGRGVKVDVVRSGYGEGRVMLAKPAMAEGMVDRIDTFDATVRRLARGGASRADRSGYDASAVLGSGREPFADRLALAAEEITTVVAHARERAELRAEEGRSLSDDDIDGLERIAGLRETLSDVDQLIRKKIGAEAAEAASAGSLRPVLDARIEAYRRGYTSWSPNSKKENDE